MSFSTHVCSGILSVKRFPCLRPQNNEFLGNVGTDLTGSHLDVATGRDEEDVAGDGKGVDSDDDDDDDDDNEGTGSRAPRQAEGVSKGSEAEGGTGSANDGGGSGLAGEGAEMASGANESKVKGDAKELEPNKLVRTFFRGLLKDWEMDLNARPDHVKRTVQGKLETKTQKQAKDYMRPLFKLCKKKVGMLRD